MTSNVRQSLRDFFMVLALIAIIWTASLAFFVLLWKTSSAEGAMLPTQNIYIQKQHIEEAMIHRIHRTLQRMVQNPTQLDKVKEKLRTLDSERLKLIDTLCLRITENPDGPSADVAFLLITGLIML
jgi:hypothetical protein